MQDKKSRKLNDVLNLSEHSRTCNYGLIRHTAPGCKVKFPSIERLTSTEGETSIELKCQTSNQTILKTKGPAPFLLFTTG